jgi:diadenosine tetraphosphate (Ap4A) HIT family hydrolase
MASARSCEAADFCSEFAGAVDVSFFRVYQGDPRSRVIAERGRLLLIADMSPLVAGHMLLLPKEHHLSFATLDGEYFGDVRSAITHICDIYVATFGQFAVLEHGSSGDLAGNACITHAHWHLVPLVAAELCRIIVDDGLIPVRLSDLAELTRPPWSTSPYFLVSDGETHTLFQPMAGSPKQYLRSVMGQALAIAEPEWDYAVVVRKDLLRETLRRTSSWAL